MFVHSWFLYKRIPCVTVSALQPTQMYLPYNMYINTSLLHLPVRVKWEAGRHSSPGTSLTVGCWNDRSLLWLTSTRYWLPCSIWCFCLQAGGLMVQLWCMREFLLKQSITSLKKKKRQRERVEEGYRCGRWASDCTDSCEGREAFQSRKWLDLPGGRQTQPDISPHCFEHPGSLRAPTEGQWSDGRPAGGREESKHGWCCFLLSE